MNKRFKSSLRVADLFGGAGLLGYAFQKEGFEISLAIEKDKIAAATHQRNLLGEIIIGDVSAIMPCGSFDVIIAGPPCQGFSSIGRRDAEDPRNSLCLQVPKWAIATGARMAVIENVPAFLKSQEWSIMCKRFRRAGYKLNLWILNARDFGVAQNRLRSITICGLDGVPDLSCLKPQAPITIREVFKGLPSFPAPEFQYFTRKQSAQSQERINLIPPGGDIRYLAEYHPHLVAPSWFRTKGKIVDIWGRIDWDGVSNTLRTGFLNPSRGRFLHPEENRPISFREAARIQGLPDSFIFEGTPEQLARQIGNGVPLGLGRAIARAVSHFLINESDLIACS